MTTTTKRPGDEILRQMAAVPGTTFTKIARELAVDRKTVRRWYLDIGIDKCGTNIPENVNKTGSNEMDLPISNKIIPENDKLIEVLQNKVAWLTEFMTNIQERIKMIENSFLGTACPIPTRDYDIVTDRNLHAFFVRISEKLKNNKILDKEEQEFFNELAIICRSALLGELARLEKYIERHWHTGMSVADSKAYKQEKANKRYGAQLWHKDNEKECENNG